MLVENIESSNHDRVYTENTGMCDTEVFSTWIECRRFPVNEEQILLIEDDLALAREITLHLREFGYQVDHTADGKEGLRRAMSEKYSLVVLDVKLPGMNGFEVCREIRAAKPVLPVLFLTSCSGEMDRVLGFELGADDYIEKPVSSTELLVRIRNKLRRGALQQDETRNPTADSGAEVLSVGHFVLDPLRRSVQVAGKTVKLTTKEFDLLYFLASNPGRVFSKAELLRAVWDLDTLGYEESVVSMIRRVRKKIGDDSENPSNIQTVWGSGYTFIATSSREDS